MVVHEINVRNLHVTRVSEATVSRLRCTLVEAHLQVEFAFMSAQLFFSESALVLISHLGPKAGSSIFWMLLGESAQRVKAQSDLRDVTAFEQISRLEDFLLGNSVLLDGGLESKKKS